MMTKYVRVLSTAALVPLVLTAQTSPERDRFPVRQWQAPPYWQAPRAQSHVTASNPQAGSPEGSTNPLVFVALPPCRVVDTRASSGFTGFFGPPSLTGGLSRTFPILSSPCLSGAPPAQAYSFNVTAVPPGLLGFITIYPTGATRPNASTLNDLLGTVVANAAIVPAGNSGSVDVFASNNTDLVIDINGYYASPSDSSSNTALGFAALSSNSGGFHDTAFGEQALAVNSTGAANTAVGSFALASNTTGGINTAVGDKALNANTTGGINTAVGTNALLNNTSGSQNTAIGGGALASNNGDNNLAIGYHSALDNLSGGQNIAIGTNALLSNTTGSQNIAIGGGALSANNGDNNIVIGFHAGDALTGGSGNIIVGFEGGGLPFLTNTTFIGNPIVQNRTFITAIRGVQTGLPDGVPVLIDSTSQLGTVNSSRRYKEDIQDMGKATDGLMRLRPVTYRYQQPYADGSKPIDYGLIAEEVEEVYPDLVARSKDGEVQTVQYQKLTPMMLNELQKLYHELEQTKARLASLEEMISNKTEAAGQK